MVFDVVDRWGTEESNVSVERMRELLASLDIEDEEHPDVSLTHESEWCLSAFPGGLLVWENVETGTDPKHMRNVLREKVLELWTKLAQGDIDAVSSEPWLDGYGWRAR
ncbi:MAG: hypothetical protein GY847_11055 [Proteobacteria bacterium]|nr:hypothetical protein [Pseudomonadota bacterium]